MRKFDLSLRSSRSSYFATFRHQLTILSKTDALDEEKWLNMLGTFVKDWFRYESHFVHGRDSLVDILKERGLLSESDAVQPLIQGSNVPNPDEAVPSFVSGAMAKAGKGLLEGTLQAGTSAVSDKLLDLVGLGGKSAADKGKDTRDYLAAAFPELNAWERAGADASSAGMVDAGFENQKELTKMQLD